MGKKYYCAYCDKAFKDDLSMRKKHLDSVQHQKLRREHYNKFRDLASILKEEILKKPCNRHTPPTQECAFGSICRFSHYSREQLIQMDLKRKYEHRVSLQL
jgi:U11/U12 small nuclear ribonucleoprotein 20 kDa protein